MVVAIHYIYYVIQLENAKQKALEIREQSFLTAEQEKKLCIRQAEQDAQRLETLKYETLAFQQKKIINQLSQQVVKLALNQVRGKLNTKCCDWLIDCPSMIPSFSNKYPT